MENQTDQLISFLKNLTSNLENNKLNEAQLKNVSEFFMSYQFQEQSRIDNQENTPKEFNHQDLIKFLSMGWYIYNILLQEKTL